MRAAVFLHFFVPCTSSSHRKRSSLSLLQCHDNALAGLPGLEPDTSQSAERD